MMLDPSDEFYCDICGACCVLVDEDTQMAYCSLCDSWTKIAPEDAKQL